MEGKSTPARVAPAEGPRPRRRRRYDSPLRSQRAAQTRDRITSEGAALVRSLPTWDWSQLTFRAVAERAGVSESTAYRHFTSERELRDAVMQRLQEEAGVTYQGVALADVADVAARVFAAMSSFTAPAQAPETGNPTLTTTGQARRRALHDAVEAAAPHWSPGQRDTAAGVLDVLWNPVSFEHLTTQCRMSPQQATDAIRWVIELIVRGIHDGAAPGPATPSNPVRGQHS